jgi:hypothetical protein
MKRRTVTIGSLAASALGTAALLLVVGPASASSSAAARYGVVNATVNAATDHEVGASTAFPNYTSGAVNNYYSLAHSHIDNSPFAEGTASPADSGPLGQTAAAQASYQQPQYADARWPGAKDGRTASFGNDGGPSAHATAGSYKATALSTNASASGSGTTKVKAPKGFARRLHVALAAWKARWLVPLHLKGPNFAAQRINLPTVPTPTIPTPTVPTPTVPGVTIPTPGGTTTNSTTSSTTTTPKSSDPPPNGGLEASTIAELDPKTGAIVTSGESRLGSVDLGGGIVLKHIDVTVEITNNGKPTGKATVTVGGATVGGVPVTIDETGVHVADQGSGLPYGQGDAALNAALKQAGIEMYTVKPQIKKTKNEMTITATGIHVVYTQPANQPGVPSQSVEHIYGEVFADSLASPAPPMPKFHLGGGGGSKGGGGGGGGSSSGGGYGGAGSSGSGSGSGYGSGSGSTTTTPGTPASFATIFGKPLWLLIAYLVFQTIVLATGATLWRWRVAAGGVA